MLDSTGKAQHGNADENHAAGQDASNNRQVRDNGRGPCIDADANQQETNHLKNNAKTETERSKWGRGHKDASGSTKNSQMYC